MTTARQVARFLRASFDRSIEPVSRVDLLSGSVIGLIGLVMHVDLTGIVVLVVLGAFLVRWLLLSPAAMWDEERTKRRARGTAEGFSVTVEAGGILNIYPPTPTDAAAASSTRSVSPAAPRSRRRTRRDPTDPPPSRAS